MARPKLPREHGTHKGYAMHLRDHTEPCDACRKAENEFQNEKRRIRVAEGRQISRPYQPRVLKVRAHFNAAQVSDFIRGKADPTTTKAIRTALREALEETKERYDGDLVADAREELAS